MADLSAEQRTRLGRYAAASRPRDAAGALDVQVALAKVLPDYWQRFDAVRLAPGPGTSGRESRRLIDWLLGR